MKEVISMTKKSNKIDQRRGNLTADNKHGKHSHSTQRKSNKGYYKLAFVEPFTNLTQRDIDLKKEYALDAIGRFYDTNKSLLHLRKKEENQSYLAIDTIYYVRLGKEPIGKVSIRVTKLFNTNSMTIVYQEKNVDDPNKKRKRQSHIGYGETRNKKSKKRRHKRNNKTY